MWFWGDESKLSLKFWSWYVTNRWVKEMRLWIVPSARFLPLLILVNEESLSLFDLFDMNSSLHRGVCFCNVLFIQKLFQPIHISNNETYIAREFEKRRNWLMEHKSYADKCKWQIEREIKRYLLSSNSFNAVTRDLSNKLKEKIFIIIAILSISEIELSRVQIRIIYHLIFFNYTYSGYFFTFARVCSRNPDKSCCHRYRSSPRTIE